MVARRVVAMSVAFSSAEPKVLIDETIAQVASFYYDLAVSAHDNAIGALRGVSSFDHVLFACDWPFAPPKAVKMNVEGFEALPLTTIERLDIERDNAARLFPRLVDMGVRHAG